MAAGTNTCIQTTVTGDGSTLPFTVTVAPILDPDALNILKCGANGLFVSGLTIAPGSCLTLAGTGLPGSPFELATTGELDDLAVFSTPGPLVVATGKSRFRFPFAATILGVTAAIDTAPTGASIILDVNKNGTSIFPISTKPTILAGAFDTGAVEVVPDTTVIASGDYLQVDIDQIGSTIAGSDLTVFVHYAHAQSCIGGL